MEKSLKLSIDMADASALRADLVLERANGRTRITVSMTLANRIAQQTIAAVQAEVLRMAIADLQEERTVLLAVDQQGHTDTPTT